MTATGPVSVRTPQGATVTQPPYTHAELRVIVTARRPRRCGRCGAPVPARFAGGAPECLEPGCADTET